MLRAHLNLNRAVLASSSTLCRIAPTSATRLVRAPAIAAHRLSCASSATHSSSSLHQRYHRQLHTSSFTSSLNASSHSESTETNSTATSSSSSSRTQIEWSIGYESDGFRVVNKSRVDDFNLTVYELRHTESGVLFYHIARADPDNAFSVAFRTPVTSSNGIAHILEHTALCGSQRYPVRDPFFLLIRRSLKTFMNAMTAQDYTLYPFSTQNAKDYQNLLDVYLDAAFFPLLNTLDFKQEGHRLEVSDATVAQAAEAVGTPAEPSRLPLQIKGVVYNEMKGAMSDTSSLFMTRMQEELFPTNSNHWNSGGEPSVIPTLTHEELKAFHRQCYNLENAVFISYGDMVPPLQTVNEKVIQPILKARTANKAGNGAAATVNRPAPYRNEQRFDTPRVIHTTCPPDPLIPDPDRQTKVSIAYLCKPFDDAQNVHEREVENIALSMLSSLLLDSATAPLYQALIDPNIGSGYAPGTGYDSNTQEPTFSIGLQGIAEEDVAKVLNIIETTLQKVAVEGFPAERIEASIHQIEINLKHVRSHFGIGVLMRIIASWAHSQDPITPLHMNSLISSLREKLKQGPYFQHLIKKHLLGNQHRVTMVMKPDVEYTKKETDAEAEKLVAQARTLTAQDYIALKEQAVQLVDLQNSKQDVKGCALPSLSVEDIGKHAEKIELQTVKTPASLKKKLSQQPSSKSSSSSSSTTFSTSSPLVSLHQPTNGVGYVRGLISTKHIPLSLRPYLPLYTSFLTEFGTKKRDYRELSHVIEMTTGGIAAEISVFSHLDDITKYEEVILFKSLALQRNIPDMIALLNEVLTEVDFTQNHSRLDQLLNQSASGCASSLQENGSGYATSDASQYLSKASMMNEFYSGIKYIQFINSIVQNLTQARGKGTEKTILDEIAQKLQQISQIIVQQGLERVFIVGDSPALGVLEKEAVKLLESGGTSPANSDVEFPFQSGKESMKSFYALPLQVNNVSMVLPTVPYTHADAPTLDVMSKILSSVYVHREVREKGGAYGGHVSHSSDGVLSFSSYRDPNSLRTLDAYHRAPQWMMDGDNFTSTDVEEALLAIFSGIDAPKPPSAKGLGQFMFGITHQQRQEYRDRLLAVNKESVLSACSRYLSPSRLASAHVSIVGDASSLPPAVSEKESGWKVQTIDLGGGEGEPEQTS